MNNHCLFLVIYVTLLGANIANYFTHYYRFGSNFAQFMIIIIQTDGHIKASSGYQRVHPQEQRGPQCKGSLQEQGGATGRK